MAPADLHAACSFLASRRPAAERADTAARFAELLTSGEFDPAGLFVSRGGGGGVTGAVLAQVLPGALGLLFPPRADREADADALLAAALAWLDGRGAKVCQAFAPHGDRGDEPQLARGGFRFVTTVVHLRKPLDPARAAAPAGPLTFAPLSPGQLPAFNAALLASHDGSRDCPELTGSRTPEDLLGGFRPPGAAGSLRRFLARHDAEPVGVVLLEDGTDPGGTELTYLGLVPAARGRGWGNDLVRFAVRTAAAGGVVALTLSVDERNRPARRLYDRHGFREVGRRDVFLRHAPAAPELQVKRGNGAGL